MDAAKTTAAKKQKWTAFRDHAWRQTINGKRQTITCFFVSCDGEPVGKFNGYGDAPSTRKADAIRRAQAARAK